MGKYTPALWTKKRIPQPPCLSSHGVGTPFCWVAHEYSRSKAPNTPTGKGSKGWTDSVPSTPVLGGKIQTLGDHSATCLFLFATNFLLSFFW